MIESFGGVAEGIRGSARPAHPLMPPVGPAPPLDPPAAWRSRSTRAGLSRAWLAVLALASSVAARGAAHPQDGPHCEIVIEIRDDSVRIRLSPNLVYLDHLLEWSRESPDAVGPSELWALRDLLLDRFSRSHPVTIDGVAVEPRIGPIELSAPDPSLVSLFPRNGMRGLLKVQFTLTYPASSPPREVGILWESYPPNELSLLDPPPPLRLAAELFSPGSRRLIEFRRDEPMHLWHAPEEPVEAAELALPAAPPPPRVRTVPVGSSLLCLLGSFAAARLLQRRGLRGAVPAAAVLAASAAAAVAAGSWWRVPIHREAVALPTVAEAESLFARLHRSLYLAFDRFDEESVYDALEEAVAGPLLPRLHASIRRSLVLEEEGGAMSRVVRFTPLEVEVESIGLVDPEGGSGESAARAGFTVRTRWEVEGAVFHWGHGHRRVNEYEGRYLVLATDRGWRIAGDTLLAQRRVDEFDGGGEEEREGEAAAAAEVFEL